MFNPAPHPLDFSVLSTAQGHLRTKEVEGRVCVCVCGGGGGKGQAIARLFSKKAQENIVGTTGIPPVVPTIFSCAFVWW